MNDQQKTQQPLLFLLVVPTFAGHSSHNDGHNNCVLLCIMFKCKYCNGRRHDKLNPVWRTKNMSEIGGGLQQKLTATMYFVIDFCLGYFVIDFCMRILTLRREDSLFRTRTGFVLADPPTRRFSFWSSEKLPPEDKKLVKIVKANAAQVPPPPSREQNLGAISILSLPALLGVLGTTLGVLENNWRSSNIPGSLNYLIP